MKPINLLSHPQSYFINKPSIGTGIGSIKGVVKLNKDTYSSSYVYLYSKSNYLPITYKKVNDDGSYAFNGLNKNLMYYLITFDLNNEYNAVVHDYIIPK